MFPFAWHNVTQLLPEGAGVFRVQRVPESVRPHLSERGRAQMLVPAGVEARTVVGAGEATLVVSAPGSAPDQPCVVREWCGRFQTERRWSVGPSPTELSIHAEPRSPCEIRPDSAPGGFSPRVRRLCFGDAGVLRVHGVRVGPGGEARPPHTRELPRLTLLAYGTSVTQGKAATQPHLTFVNRCAALLGVDAVNLGCAGSAHCEPALADHIARRTDWHLAVLGLSLNMMWMEHDEFRDRAAAFVDRVAGTNPDRPVFCVTLWPHAYDYGVGLRNDNPGTDLAERAAHTRRMREGLREIVRHSPHPNVRCLEGPALLPSITGLSSDLLHPSDTGMAEIATRLADELRPAVDRLRSREFT